MRWSRIAGARLYLFLQWSAFAVAIPFGRCALAVSHRLGHVLMAKRSPHFAARTLVEHARATALYNVYYGRAAMFTTSRAAPRTRASLILISTGTPTTAISLPEFATRYSPFSTWTRGPRLGDVRFCRIAGVHCHAAAEDLDPLGGREEIEFTMRERHGDLRFLYRELGRDGIPYWDTGGAQSAKWATGGSAGRSFNRYDRWMFRRRHCARGCFGWALSHTTVLERGPDCVRCALR